MHVFRSLMHSYIGLLPLSILDCIISWVHFCTITIWDVLTIIPWVRFALFAVACVYNSSCQHSLFQLLYFYDACQTYLCLFFNLKATQVFTSATVVTNSSANRTPTVTPNTVLTVPDSFEMTVEFALYRWICSVQVLALTVTCLKEIGDHCSSWHSSRKNT